MLGTIGHVGVESTLALLKYTILKLPSLPTTSIASAVAIQEKSGHMITQNWKKKKERLDRLCGNIVRHSRNIIAKHVPQLRVRHRPSSAKFNYIGCHNSSCTVEKYFSRDFMMCTIQFALVFHLLPKHVIVHCRCTFLQAFIIRVLYCLKG